MKSIIIVLLLLSSSSAARGIQITQGPNNITAYVGDSVTLPCMYTGTADKPYWRIGGVIHPSSYLPDSYEYTNEGLYIPSVWALLNNTAHTCFFTVYIGGGMFANIESQPAYIIVKIRSGRILPTSSDFAQNGINTGQLSSSLISSSSISPTLQMSPTHAYYVPTSAVTTSSLSVEYSTWLSIYSRGTCPTTTNSLTVCYSNWQSVLATPQKNIKQMQTSTQLISGISASVMVLVLICVIVIICLTVCFIIRTHRQQKSDNPEYQEPEAFQLQQVPRDSANEEPTVLCQLQNNIAYEIPTSKIKTAENEAYGAISNL